jgi:hypothetical protein
MSVEEFEVLLQETFWRVLRRTGVRIPQTKTGFEVLMALCDADLPHYWRHRFTVQYVNPTQEQMARRLMPEPEVRLRKYDPENLEKEDA